MCGITGFISKKYTEEQLRCMSNRLAHRGPDADGFYYNQATGTGLGHRRLSIIDLSEAANQPFYSHDKRYVMIYNGEVYNFKEIASKYNIHPHTHSDTEIILEAFAKAGVDSINDLNGMFALAIWDTQEEKLYLIRDRIGVKPLYYTISDNNFAFASELKALFLLPEKKEIDHDSIAQFLHLGYIPGEATIYKNYNKLLPGHYAIWHKGSFTAKPYWTLTDKLDKTPVSDENSAKKHLKTLLESSVNYCMISDVPVGVFLSGGVDSSTVAAVAQSTSAIPVSTFSIGFEEKKYNESHFAAEVAKHIGSNHHEFIVTEQDALHLVEKLLDMYDEPYADSSAIPTFLVSQLARKHVTVALSGDGGDELFMGYGFYFWAKRLNNPLVKAFRKPISKALYHFGSNRLKRGSTLFDYDSFSTIKSHIFSQEQYYFTNKEIGALLKKPGQRKIDETYENNVRKLSLVEEQSFFDITNYLPEELLVKVDRASMANSLEVRVPLLDHRLVEFAINLSESLKLRDKTGKYLLKQALYDYIPASLFNRPKWGFAVPLQVWMKTELSYLIEKFLSDQVVEESGLVNVAVVRQLIKEFRGGRDYLYNRLWALIILHKWYKEKHS
jgi:asparagine synthase (glutamine-hydrolysing)